MNGFWKMIETVLHFFIYKIFRMKMRDENFEKLCQFVKFGVVGLSNTVIMYVVYVILVALSVHYLIANFIGFMVSVVNAYYWNDRYVFVKEDGQKRIWWKTFIKTFLSYSGTGLILNNVLLFIWVDLFHIGKMIAPVLNLFITIPTNFLLNKFWAFRKREK